MSDQYCAQQPLYSMSDTHSINFGNVGYALPNNQLNSRHCLSCYNPQHVPSSLFNQQPLFYVQGLLLPQTMQPATPFHLPPQVHQHRVQASSSGYLFDHSPNNLIAGPNFHFSSQGAFLPSDRNAQEAFDPQAGYNMAQNIHLLPPGSRNQIMIHGYSGGAQHQPANNRIQPQQIQKNQQQQQHFLHQQQQQQIPNLPGVSNCIPEGSAHAFNKGQQKNQVATEPSDISVVEPPQSKEKQQQQEKTAHAQAELNTQNCRQSRIPKQQNLLHVEHVEMNPMDNHPNVTEQSEEPHHVELFTAKELLNEADCSFLGIASKKNRNPRQIFPRMRNRQFHRMEDEELITRRQHAAQRMPFPEISTKTNKHGSAFSNKPLGPGRDNSQLTGLFTLKAEDKPVALLIPVNVQKSSGPGGYFCKINNSFCIKRVKEELREKPVWNISLRSKNLKVVFVNAPFRADLKLNIDEFKKNISMAIEGIAQGTTLKVVKIGGSSWKEIHFFIKKISSERNLKYVWYS